MAELPAIVLDNGTSYVKCGFASALIPPLVVPTVASKTTFRQPQIRSTTAAVAAGQHGHDSRGVPLRLHSRTAAAPPPHASFSVLNGFYNDRAAVAPHHPPQQYQLRRHLYGDEVAAEGHAAQELTYPMRDGRIDNMEVMMELWDYLLCHRLPALLAGQARPAGPTPSASSAPAERNDGAWLTDRRLLLSETSCMPPPQRREVVESLFEDYKLAAVQLAAQDVLALFANGLESGVVVEIGEATATCTPVYDGFVLAGAARRIPLAGQTVTSYLGHLLRQRGETSNRLDAAMLRRMKEQHCYVAADAAKERGIMAMSSSLQQEHRCILPDGEVLTVGAASFEAPEVLFCPSLMDLDCSGLSDALWSCLEAVDVDLRTELYSNIILSGGTSMLPGLHQRLQGDMQNYFLTRKRRNDAVLRRPSCPVAIKAPPHRRYLVYTGGTLLAKLSFGEPTMWVTRAEYEEFGVSAVLQRFKSLGVP